jgi:hypothetical protein
MFLTNLEQLRLLKMLKFQLNLKQRFYRLIMHPLENAKVAPVVAFNATES